AVNIEPDTFARLASIPTIVGVKEASGNLQQMRRILELTRGKLALLSGDDALTLPVMELGGTGVISVVANVVPQDVAAMVTAFEEGRRDEAQRWHERLLPLTKAMFIETNPIPVKTAMGMLGWIQPQLRLPLCAMSAQHARQLRQALRDYGLLSSRVGGGWRGAGAPTAARRTGAIVAGRGRPWGRAATGPTKVTTIR
ncbi:MAG: dihydrodipicolinate synthase family protein, partial [Candidatus Omnitrophica bacterium]|nr:dihydrodipicolinate synthase family protein [Candidatus Omnitrophota bacterium]